MAEKPPRYRAILTDDAFRMEALALASGVGIVLDEIAVGDGGGEDVDPQPEVTELVHEVWRDAISVKEVDPEDANITQVMLMIPASVGGFFIREIGVYGHIEGESEKFLYVYASTEKAYKTLPQDGESQTREIWVPIVHAGNADVTIQVADLGYVTRSEFRAENLKHKLWLAQLQTCILRNINSQLAIELQQ